MANKFTVGMRNLVEVLNQMWDAFAAGPYNALPLTGGNLTGPVTSTSYIAARQIIAGTSGALNVSSLSVLPNEALANTYSEVARFAVAGTSGAAFSGAFLWSARNARNGSFFKTGYQLQLSAIDTESSPTSTLFSVDGQGTVEVAGNLLVGGLVQAGNTGAPHHGMYKAGGENTEILWVGRQGQPSPCVAMNGSSGQGGWGSAGSVLYLGKNSSTSRSANFSGTINASGADYAEYMVKRFDCGEVKAGQLVGIDADGRLTDKWDTAVAFAVKSTNPCMVGGDVWSGHLGPRPEAPALVEQLPAPPVRAVATADLEGDTDDTWAQRLKTYAMAVESHQAAMAEYIAADEAYQAASSEYEAALESARQTVDRIAFAGQVPVNLQGAAPGQFIVPVQDGDSIAGLAIDEADITLRQYMRAIGRVIAIEDDGRARIIVKVA